VSNAGRRAVIVGAAECDLGVTDKSILDGYFRIRARIMGEHNPPATLLIVNEFPRPGVEVEIEAVAAKAD